MEHWRFRFYGKTHYRGVIKETVGTFALPSKQIGELIMERVELINYTLLVVGMTISFL
jgi:hypothetical protein